MNREWRPEPQLAAAASEPDDIDLLELARTLWRGKLWIGLTALVMCVLAYGYVTQIAVPKYTAHTTVVLENRQESLLSFDSVVSGLSGDQATINTEVEVLRSRKLAGKVVDEMGLIEDPEFNEFLSSDEPLPSDEIVRDAVIGKLLDAISISNVRSSYVFDITVVTAGAAKSANISNTLADLYVQDQLEVKFEATEQATSWLSNRVATLKSELEVSESKLQSFAAGTDLVSAEQLEALNRQVKESRDRLQSLTATRDSRAERVTELEAAKAGGDIAAMVVAAQDIALSRSAEAGASASVLTARFDVVLNRTRDEAMRADGQVLSFERSIKSLEEQFTRQSRDLVELEQLQRETEATRAIYEYFLTRLKETSIQQGIQQPDSRVLSYAPLPRNPSEPRVIRIFGLALIFGLLLGAGFILVRELQHTGFRTGEQIERETGLTVMGQVPRIPGRSRDSIIAHLVDNPTSAAAEAVRNLRTSLLLSNVDRPPQVILSTSSVPGEGKTTNSIALAQNFAGLGKRVLLIEGDIRRRVFAEYFSLPDKGGLLAVLSGDKTFDETVHSIERIGADIILGEASSTNAADVFSSDKFSAFMKQARDRYDIIIIDTPPVLVVPDARIIAHAVDAVLFSIHWDKTSRAQVVEALRQFEVAGRPVTGVVLNQIDPKGMKKYGYGGQYGAYGAYGKKYYTG